MRKSSQYCQSPLILLKCMRGNNIYILLPFNILFVSNQTILKRKSPCLKAIETIAILKRLLPILLTLPLSYNCDISIVRCIVTSLVLMSLFIKKNNEKCNNAHAHALCHQLSVIHAPRLKHFFHAQFS